MSQLEHGLNAAAQSKCRELMEALLTSEASVRDGYVREKGERHGGTHEKAADTLFWPVGPVPSAYFHGKDADGTKSGHYPWDERMGLLGQHTPAVVSECGSRRCTATRRPPRSSRTRTDGGTPPTQCANGYSIVTGAPPPLTVAVP